MKKNPLKILFLCSWYPNRKQPTLGNFVEKHAKAIAQLNTVCVLSLVNDSESHNLECSVKDNGSFHEIIVYYKIPGGFLGKIRKYFIQRKAFLKGYELVIQKIGNPDILHLNVTYPIGIWAKWLRAKKSIPYVISEHSSGFQNGPQRYPAYTLSLCKSIFRDASVIMPVSDDLGQHIRKLSPCAKIIPVSNVVNETIFHPGKQDGYKSQLIHVSTAFEPAKNLSGILRTIKMLSLKRNDFILQIISDGDIKAAHELSRELGILNSFVSFHGTKSTEEVADMMRKSRALILFSNYENFPCVIPEAWMSGIPVIATSVNGIPEYANKENSILINKGDENGLSLAIEEILNDSRHFDPTELRAYALKNFSYRFIGEKFDSIYRSELNR
jgi:glycosyltransferase involved in cell wall biosynthesis